MIKLIDIINTTPGLEYHLQHKLPISENIYRYSSDAFVNLFGEARELWKTGMLELPLPDVELLETTDIGRWGIYEGQKVPLDLPMLYESGKDTSTDSEIDSKIKKYLKVKTVIYDDSPFTFTLVKKNPFNIQKLVDKGIIHVSAPGDGKGGVTKPNWEGEASIITFLNLQDPEPWMLDSIKKPMPKAIPHVQKDQDKLFYDGKYNQILWGIFKKGLNPKEFFVNNLNEAEYKGKDVQLNKPKRGGPKKFYVYVKDPKTGNVKKVNFGDSGNLTVKLNEPGARASFAARHDCANKKDKTKPGYWSCNIGRYWKSLGGSKNFSGYW